MAVAARSRLEVVLRGSILAGAYVLTLLPLVVTPSLVYPETSGKGLALRAAAAVLFFLWVGLAAAVPRYRPRWSPVMLAVVVWLGFVGASNLAGVDPYRSFWGTPLCQRR